MHRKPRWFWVRLFGVRSIQIIPFEFTLFSCLVQAGIQAYTRMYVLIFTWHVWNFGINDQIRIWVSLILSKRNWKNLMSYILIMPKITNRNYFICTPFSDSKKSNARRLSMHEDDKKWVDLTPAHNHHLLGIFSISLSLSRVQFKFIFKETKKEEKKIHSSFSKLGPKGCEKIPTARLRRHV